MIICCLCGKEFEGYGNSSYPLKNGRCCDVCNYKKVVPARIKKIVKGEISGDDSF